MEAEGGNVRREGRTRGMQKKCSNTERMNDYTSKKKGFFTAQRIAIGRGTACRGRGEAQGRWGANGGGSASSVGSSLRREAFSSKREMQEGGARSEAFSGSQDVRIPVAIERKRSRGTFRRRLRGGRTITKKKCARREGSPRKGRNSLTGQKATLRSTGKS